MRPRRFVPAGHALLVALAPASDRRLARERRECGGPGEERERGAGTYPSDWFGMQRAFPGTRIPQEKFAAAVEQAQLERALQKARPEAGTAALTWENAGPFNIGGRVTALAVVPGADTIYLASANGGVFQSTNAGVNWKPIFDEQAVYSVGALALHPTNHGVLYAGTGEANASADSYDGAGLFRTSDGGLSWQHLGLEATRRIGRVALDPANPSRIFVAAMGPQYSTGPDRGLYLSEDAGTTWTNVLFVNDSTGVCDVAINPQHPDTVFAASWERIRRPTYRRAFGPGSGIWRSTDAGHTWTRLAAGLPAPSDSVGRIALAIPRSRPSWVYAQIIGGSNVGYRALGLWRSTSGGDTWTRRDVGTSFTGMFGGFGWYFGDLHVDPTNANRVFALGVPLRRSTDGGATFTSITGTAHVDQHALWIDPSNPQRIYLGNDGGFFSSTTGGGTWFKSVDLPITQFYAGTIDPGNPARLLGGTQDNFTLLTAGPPDAWTSILGGDGFQCLVDPLDPDVLFAEYQYCCYNTGPQRSIDGGATFQSPTGIDTGDRFNWNTPLVMDPGNHLVVLVGSQRVYRSSDNGLSYAPISPDLSTNPPALLVYGTITTLDISPLDGDLYYAGTDDGRVWRSQNAGGTWEEISSGLPVRWVTRVTADRFDSQVVYATLSGYALDEHLAHVYRSADRGTTWTPIDANLPDAPVNDLQVDASDPYTLFVATDVGVWATRNGGASWFPLGDGMPLQTVFDLTLHAPSRTLVAATHGRGQWKLDLSGLPSDVAAPSSARLRLSPPAPNPSRAAVRFALDLDTDAPADVSIYDVSGRRIRVLHDGPARRGSLALVWDGRDAAGLPVAPGVYFLRARSAGAVAVQRVVRAE
jgi:photosystem II stability/assembly factor-like uncharacterized protein